jgi:hypothetical protein
MKIAAINRRRARVELTPFAVAFVLIMFGGATAAEQVKADRDIRDVIARSVPFIERNGAEWIANKKCLPCHQTTFMLWSLDLATREGIPIGDAATDTLYIRSLTVPRISMLIADRGLPAYHGGISPGTTAARAGDMIRRNSTGGLQLKTKNITCAVCGAISKPLEIEFVATVDAPSEIIDVISWIHCPKCGPRKQPAQSDSGTF